MRKQIRLIVILLITSMGAYAQIPELPKSMLSPNAAGLGEYGEVPVSPFTGIPQIEIPIYEINDGVHSLPISLSYHAGGIRPDQHPGWTGLGWSLNAGGCISRTIKDMPDEFKILYQPANNLIITNGGLYYQKAIFIFDWDDKTILKNVLWNIASDANYSNSYDTEPDEFNFNFCGYTGSFYLNEKGEWSVRCDKPLKIVFDEPNGFTTTFSDRYSQFNRNIEDNSDVRYIGRSHSFKGFTIIAEDGTKYIFGGTDNAIEFSMDFYGQFTDAMMANTWYLTKIIYPDTKTMDFTYERGDYIAQMYYSLFAVINNTSVGGAFPSKVNIGDGCEGMLILPTYLKNIKYMNTQVIFDKYLSIEKQYDLERMSVYKYNSYREKYPTNNDGFLPILQFNGNYEGNKNYANCLKALKWYKLENIRVKDSKQNYIRSFSLRYNDNPNERLMLKRVTEYCDISSERGRKYSLEYYSPELLPNYFSKQTDHWGFYNGKNPQYDMTNRDVFYNSREPSTNLEQSLSGTLKKITYPTGGYSKFIYEPHDYVMIIDNSRTNIYYTYGANIMAGGLRIKSIINSPTKDEKDEYTNKKYHYRSDLKDGKRSSGVLDRFISYGYNDYKVMSIDKIPGRASLSVFSSQSVLPVCTNTAGIHVSYNNVVEENADGSYKVYYYTNHSTSNFDSPCDASLQEELTAFDSYSSRSQERGLPRIIFEYDSNSQLKKKTEIEYERDGNDYVRSMKTAFTDLNTGYWIYYCEGVAYRNYIYSMRKKQVTESIYENNSEAKPAVSKYLYNDYKMPKEITTYGNDGDTYVDTYKYCTDPGVFNLKMKERNMLGCPLEVTSRIRRSYASYPLSSIRYYYNQTNPIKPDSVVQRIRDNTKGTVSQFKYDPKYNLAYSVKNKEKTVYIWGYYCQYIIAEIKNATIDQVYNIIGNITTFSAAEFPDFSKIDELRQKLPKAMVTSYTYIPGVGLKSVTGPNGVKTNYVYDTISRLKAILDNNNNIVNTYRYQFHESK